MATKREVEKRMEQENEAREARKLMRQYSSVEGVAQALGWSVSTVKRRLALADTLGPDEALPATTAHARRPSPSERVETQPDTELNAFGAGPECEVEVASKEVAIRAAQQAMVDAQADARRCRSQGNDNGARQAQRIFLAAATLLGKLVKDDEKEGVYVTPEELARVDAELEETMLKYATPRK